MISNTKLMQIVNVNAIVEKVLAAHLTMVEFIEALIERQSNSLIWIWTVSEVHSWSRWWWSWISKGANDCRLSGMLSNNHPNPAYMSVLIGLLIWWCRGLSHSTVKTSMFLIPVSRLQCNHLLLLTSNRMAVTRNNGGKISRTFLVKKEELQV